MINRFLQLGHAACFPAFSSGAERVLLQDGQVKRIGKKAGPYKIVALSLS